MKKILIISILFLIVGFTISCEEDFEAPYGDYSSFSWYTGDGIAVNFDTTEKNIDIDNYIAFYDVSQNAISHKWTIPASCRFLNKEFTEKDSIYTPFIVPGTVSNEDLANVLFLESGIQEISIVNTFKDSVPNSSKLLDGTWVIEQKFTVDVYANPNPACEVFKYDYTDPAFPVLVKVLTLTEDQMPSEEDMGSWPTVSIEAGQELIYVDKSTAGRPTGRKWYVNGGKPETSSNEEAAIKYNKLGEFTGYMESIRSADGIPKKTISKLIPLKIEVLPSTAPFVQSGKISVEDNVISFSVTGEVDLMVKQEEFFTVHVTNTAAGFDEDLAVATAKINSDDATIIELTLAEPVYNTDEITLSFAGGNIVSVDARVLADFEPTKVDVPLGNSVLVDSWAGFETFKDNWKSAFCTGFWVGNTNDDGGSKVETIFKRVEDKVFEGTGSMRYKYDLSKKITLQGSDFSKPSGLDAGTYRVSYMIYKETDGLNEFKTGLQGGTAVTLTWDISGLEVGIWHEVSQIVTTVAIASGSKFNLFIDNLDGNSGVTGEQIIYFDSQKWIPLNPRP